MKSLGILVAILLFPFNASGRGILLSPVQLGLSGTPGSTVSGVISVSSPRSEANKVRVSFADFAVQLDGKRVEVAASAPGVRSARGWLESDQEQFTSPERGTIPIVITVRIPENASGSYWASALFEVQPAPGLRATKGASSLGMNLIPRIGIPIIVTVAGTERYGLTIHEVSATKSGPSVRASILVENTGNTAVMLNGAVTIERTADDIVEELAAKDIETVTSYPGVKRRIVIDLPLTGPTAGAELHAYFRYGPADDQIAETSVDLQRLLSANDASATASK